MPFPNTPVLDNFNRADAASLGANWMGGIATDDYGNGLKIVGNAALGVTNYSFSSSYWNAAVFGPDCEVYGTFILPPTQTYKAVRLWARMTDIGTGTFAAYRATVLYRESGGADLSLHAVVGNTATQIASGSGAIASGDVWGLGVVGSAVTLYRNDSAVLSATDTTIANAGRIGISLERDEWTLDNFGGGTIGASGTTLYLVATAAAASRSFGLSTSFRSLWVTARASGQPNGRVTPLRSVRAATRAGGRPSGRLTPLRGLRAMVQSRSQARASQQAAAVLLLIATARVSTSATMIGAALRMVAASAQAQARATGVAVPVRQFSAAARAQSRSNGMPVAERRFIATGQSYSQAQTTEQAQRLLFATARVSTRPAAIATRSLLLAAQSRTASIARSYWGAGQLLQLIASGYVPSRSAATATPLRAIRATAYSRSQAQTEPRMQRALVAQTQLMAQARGTLARAVVLVALARSTSTGTASLLVARALAARAFVSARSAARLSTAARLPKLRGVLTASRPSVLLTASHEAGAVVGVTARGIVQQTGGVRGDLATLPSVQGEVS